MAGEIQGDLGDRTSRQATGAQASLKHFTTVLDGLDVKATKSDPFTFVNQEK